MCLSCKLTLLPRKLQLETLYFAIEAFVNFEKTNKSMGFYFRPL